MAELVNQRIEDMINELEQMQRTNLYNDEEIKEISRKRKQFEYKVQRRVKEKEDYTQYIAFELALLEDISLRRKQNKLGEKKKDIEYAIAKRLNKLFKQFIYRFQNDVGIYFEYIKFCYSVGFDAAISNIIGQMLQWIPSHVGIPGNEVADTLVKQASDDGVTVSVLPFYTDCIYHIRKICYDKWKEYFDRKEGGFEVQKRIHGDKPKMWQLAAKWECVERENLEDGRGFLIKGIQRHEEADILYLDLFETELKLAFKTEDVEEREKQLKRASVVWKNGVNNIKDVTFLFKLCEISFKYEVAEITDSIKEEIWAKRDKKEVWSYIAAMELNGCHWEEVEEFVDDENHYSKEINNYIAVYEEALQQFPDKNLCTKYIHGLLGASESLCTDIQKISVVKRAWRYGHDNGLLTDNMYAFGIEMFKLENEISEEELMEILDTATKHNPQSRCIWEEKLHLNKSNDKKTLSILQDAHKSLKAEDSHYLWNLVLNNIESKDMLQNLYKRFKCCENSTLLAIKPKLLQKMYEHTSLKAAEELYEEMIRTPPTQIEIHKIMIDIEMSQAKPNVKNIRKCYECAVQHHGTDNVELWLDYVKFETEFGSPQNAPAIYRRSIGTLKKELVDDFITAQTLAKIK